jgi:hypothetical protein
MWSLDMRLWKNCLRRLQRPSDFSFGWHCKGDLLELVSIVGVSGSCTPSTTSHQLWPKIFDTTSSVYQQTVGEPYTCTRHGPTTPG